MAEKISQKKAPRIKDAEMQTALNRIYDHINELVTSVNAASTDAEGVGDGKEGDMRVVKTSGREVKLEIRVDEGWYSSTVVDTDPDVTKLTDSSGGASTNNTIEEVTDVPTAKNGIKELATKLNEVIDIINNMNSSGFKMIDRRSN
tara:strand:+ start:1185 stop:1622 length:438 start_codon:yes stop_codon:yes gene_type:complete